MLTIAIIVSVALVIAVSVAALAYGGPKIYWYWSQNHLLGLQAEDQRMLMKLHVKEHEAELPDQPDITINGKPLSVIDDNTGLYL